MSIPSKKTSNVPRYILLAVCLLCLSTSYSRYKDSHRIEAKISTWKTTIGSVVKSRVRKYIQSASSGNSYNFLGIDFEFTYTTDSRIFTGTIIHGFYTVENAEAQLVAKTFPVGAPVNVFYNPLRPSESIAAPTSAHDSYSARIYLMWGVVFFCLSFARFEEAHRVTR